jgi:lipoprotein NlpI
VFRDDSRFACALSALEQHDFFAAERRFSEVLARDQLSSLEQAFVLNKRGVARIGLGQRDLARGDFIAALESAPRFAPALTNLGNLLLDRGEVDAAIEHYENAIAADPEYAVAYLNLSVAYKRCGRIADAVRALRRSQRIEARRPETSAGSFWRPARRR